MDKQFFPDRATEIKFFIILVLVLSVFLTLSFVFGSKLQRGDSSVPSEAAYHLFPEVTLGAKAVYVYDVRTQTVLFAKNENARLPLASLTKVMSALVAQDNSPMYGTITVSDEALRAEGDSGLYRDERWTLKDLVDFSLITSSNDGIRAMALTIGALSQADATPIEIINDFVGKMNLRANELGLKDTYFWNETGLDESDEKGGAYGTASDMSVLVEYVLKNYPDLLSATRDASAAFSSLDNRNHLARNTNDIVGEIPGLLISKTGFTDTAGGNLVIVFDPEIGRPIIISILGSTEEGRFVDARVLVGAVLEYLNNN